MKINIEKDLEIIKQKVLLENTKIRDLYMGKYIRDTSGKYHPNIIETSLTNGTLIGPVSTSDNIIRGLINYTNKD